MTATMTPSFSGASVDRYGGFRGWQVCRIAGITYRQLDYWARTDLLRPSITEASGSGTQRRYSYSDVVRGALIKLMLDGGLSLQSVRYVARSLDASDLTSDDAFLVVEGRHAYVVPAGDVADLVRECEGLVAVTSLDAVLRGVDEAIGSFVPAPRYDWRGADGTIVAV